MNSGHQLDLADWIPIRLYQEGQRTMVDWCEVGGVRFVDPFFHQTVDRVMVRPATALFRRQTPVEVLEALAVTEPGCSPAGFIFHASRCGSTLATQMLAASESNRVLSEPGPVDEILRAGLRLPAVPEERLMTWVRAMISALGRTRGAERRLFVKFDPWHVLALPLIRKAFPDVPWIFLVRDPLEILVAQSRSLGSQFMVGPLPPDLFGVDLATAANAPPGAYAAHVLEHLLRAAIRHFGDAGLVLDYRDLPGGFDRILDHFGVESDAEERAVMTAAAIFDAKMPQRIFQPDSESKRAAADEDLRHWASKVRPTYDELLRLRNQRRAVAVS